MMLICLTFGFAAAWCQPYESGTANLFKVATEVALLVTLIISGMLRVDLAGEKLPALLSLPGGGLDRGTIGLLLVLANTLVPATRCHITMLTRT